MASKKEVAKKEENLPVNWEELEKSSGRGTEDISSGDMTVPILRIIQNGSPELRKGEGKHLEEAEEGMILNTATRELYDPDNGILVFVVSSKRIFMEWNPRTKGGGLRANHGTDKSCIEGLEVKDNKYMTKEGHEIVPTRTFYVLILNEKTGELDWGIIPMAGSQNKPARDINYMLKRAIKTPNGKYVIPDTWMFGYRLRTVSQKNDKGTWKNWSVERDKFFTSYPCADEIKALAKEYYKAIEENRVKSNDDELDNSEGDEDHDAF